MSQKLKNIKVHLLYVLMQLLLECLDALKPTNPRMAKLKEDLVEMCELLNTETENTFTVQRSTYFQVLSNQINTLMRKTYNPNV